MSHSNVKWIIEESTCSLLWNIGVYI